jgi:hypothetical protein
MVQEDERPIETPPIIPPSQRPVERTVPSRDKRAPVGPKTEVPPGVVEEQVFERIRRRRGI